MIRVDSAYIYIVSVAFDRTFKFCELSKIQKKDILNHEFQDEKSANEYIELLKEVNEDKIGRFIFKKSEMLTSESKKYTQLKFLKNK